MSKINPVVQELIDKTLQELNHPKKPLQKSRVSNTPNGYIFLVAWSNASLLRVFARKFTAGLPKSEYRLKAQFDDNTRSVVANIEEGFARPTTSEYLTFLGYAQASLIEGKGDIQRSLQDGFLRSILGSSLKNLGIDLSDWHEALKRLVISRPVVIKGTYRNIEESRGKEKTQGQIPKNSFQFLYKPVDNLKAEDLTYEIFIELINKTDWHLRRLVESLEEKLAREQKYYQVEKARMRSKLHLE